MPEILREKDGPVTRITLNRPEDGNKVSDPMAVELTEMLKDAAKDSQIIVFTGAGDNFCLGRAGMGRNAPSAPPEALDLRDGNETVFNAYGAFRDIACPVVGIVKGQALGFGCALASVCDITIAADDAEFQLPEMGHNIMPTMAMSSLVDRLHRKSAVYMLYSTAMIDANKALAYGLVSDVFPAAELDAAADNLIATMLKAPMAATLAAKEYARVAFTMDMRAANDLARNLHAVVNSSSRMRRKH